VVKLAGDVQVRWNPTAEEIFHKYHARLQFPEDGCVAVGRADGFIAANVDMHWGMGSVMRDVSNQLLFGLLMRRTLVWSNNTFIDPGDFGACARGQFWLEACFFQKFSSCQYEYESGRMGKATHVIPNTGGDSARVARDSSWFLEQSQYIWDEMLETGSITFHTCTGQQLSRAQDVRKLLDSAGPAFEHSQRLSVFRSLMLRVTFRPNSLLEKHVQELTASARLGASKDSKFGLMIAVHMRRTDKIKDYRGRKVPSMLEESGTKTSVQGLCNKIHWLESTVGSVSSFFFMSDDPRSFKDGVLEHLTRCFSNPSVVRMQSEFIRTGSVSTLSMEALSAGHETWGNKSKLYLDALAEVFAASQHASYIVGCGSAGLSQLTAQLIGGRVGLDPNLISLWEDDAIAETCAASSGDAEM